MMDSRAAADLKTIDPAQRVQSIRLCGDTYQVTSANGATRDYANAICASRPTRGRKGWRKVRRDDGRSSLDHFCHPGGDERIRRVPAPMTMRTRNGSAFSAFRYKEQHVLESPE
jgi:hypothetical protein